MPFDSTEDYNRCYECGSEHLVRDYERGELICNDCGMVLEDSFIDQDPEWRAFDSEQDDRGARTHVNSNPNIQPRLGITKDYGDISLYMDGNRIVNEFGIKLGLPKDAISHASQVFASAYYNNLINRKNTEAVACGSLYISSVLWHFPQTPNEISKITHVSRKKVEKAIRFLNNKLGLGVKSMGSTFSLNAYLEKICYKAGFGENVIAISKDIASKYLSTGSFSEKRIESIAAASIYMASLMSGKNLTLENISMASGISENSLRKRYYKISKSLGIPRISDKISHDNTPVQNERGKMAAVEKDRNKSPLPWKNMDIKNVVLAGFVGSGKSTFVSLFLYAGQYVKTVPGFKFLVEEASELVRNDLKTLLSGNWPSGTSASETRTGSSLVLSRNGKLVKKQVSMTINDSSGEIWRDVAKSSERAGEVLEAMIRANPSLVTLQTASGYMIAVDCDKFDLWDSEQFSILSLLKSIRILNGGKKVKKPVSILLMKFNLLSEEIQQMHPYDILKHHLNYVHSYIEEYFSGNFIVFRSGIKLDRQGKPQVTVENGKKRLTMIGTGPMGDFPDIFKWILNN